MAARNYCPGQLGQNTASKWQAYSPRSLKLLKGRACCCRVRPFMVGFSSGMAALILIEEGCLGAKFPRVVDSGRALCDKPVGMSVSVWEL